MTKRQFLKRALMFVPVVAICAAFLIATTRPALATVPGINTLVSVDSNGNEGNDRSGQPGQQSGGTGMLMSKDGRYVVFNSKATNLVSGDTNGKVDIFVRDLENDTTSRVSVSTAGTESDGDSDLMAVSETGRYIIFRSDATNLLDGQTLSNSKRFYMHDLHNGETTYTGVMDGPFGIVSGVSNDGRFMLFETMSGNYRLYLYEINSQNQTRLDAPLDGTQQNVDMSGKFSAMSCDGAFAVFESGASNLVEGDTNGQRDIFLADLRNGVKVTNVTSNSDGESQNPNISCNGRYIIFSSMATNLASGGSTGSNGHYYRYDRVNDSFELLDISPTGQVAISTGPMYNYQVDISDEGIAAFGHGDDMDNLSHNKRHIYLRDPETDITSKLSVNSSGQSHYDESYGHLSMSADGSLVAYNKVPYYSFLLDNNNTQIGVVVSETGL